MVIYELDAFLAAMDSALKVGELPTIISERQFEVFKKIAKDIMSKGQTNHIYGKSEEFQQSGGGATHKDEGVTRSRNVTTGSIKCPVCAHLLSISLSG